MKINIEIDCTPQEARTLMGLPDVQPMQAEMMEKVRAKMMEGLGELAPEKLMQSWFDPKMAERFQDMFGNLAGLAGGGKAGGKK